MPNESNENPAAKMDQPEMNFTREECFAILGIPADSGEDAVKQRYGALLRQYKRRVDEKGTTYEDLAYYNRITRAYDLIMGFSHDYTDDNPTSPVPLKVRRAWGKWCTVFGQYRVAFLLVAVLLCMAIVFIVQIRSNRKEDLVLKFVGAYYSENEKLLMQELNERSETFDSVQFSFFTVTTGTDILDNTAKTQATAFLSQLMAGSLDVILIDKESFDVYVEESAFLPLDGYLDEYYAETGKRPGGLYQYAGEADGEDPASAERVTYGIEVSGSAFLDGLPLNWLYDASKGQEKTMIFAICRTSKRPEMAWSFGKELLQKIG